MTNILIQNNCSDMNSGASHSLVNMAVNLKRNSDYNPIVLLMFEGELESVLRKYGIQYYIVHVHERWIMNNNLEVTLRDAFIDAGLFLVGDKVRAKYRIKKIIKENDIKIVHINMLTCYLAAEVAYSMNIPVVWHIREFLEEGIGRKFRKKEFSIKMLQQAYTLIAVSNAVKNKYEMILNRNDIKCIYNGVDFHNIDESHPNSIFVHERDIVYAIVGRICKGKGQLKLVKAIASLPAKLLERIQLQIWGNIEEPLYMEEIRNYISENGLSQCISYMGTTTNIYKTLEDVDCLCVCSEKEAFGRTIAEGMIAGCLVLANNTGGPAEIITQKITGLLYSDLPGEQLKDQLIWCMENSDSVRNIAKAGQNYAAKNFAINNNITSVKEIYSQLISSK